MSRRLRLDPLACDAFGYCAELAPELVALDEWGYPVLDEQPIPRHLEGVAELAVRSCPRKALFWEAVERPTPVSVVRSRQRTGRR